jgi:hypothetical protein
MIQLQVMTAVHCMALNNVPCIIMKNNIVEMYFTAVDNAPYLEN